MSIGANIAAITTGAVIAFAVRPAPGESPCRSADEYTGNEW